MIVIHDLHLGVQRSAGTTPASATALTVWMQQQFDSILDRVNEDLVILGDLFDTYQVSLRTVLATYTSLSDWLRKGHNLCLIPGNHDLSTDSSKLSSFQFLAQLLLEHPNVTYHSGGGFIADGVYAISHVTNQDLIDMELAKVPKCKYLLLHCNYDNNFAKASDHSLNISREQCENLPADVVFFAHEHYYREELRGKVFIAGNQFPSSVSDCLHKTDKFMTRLADKPERLMTWAKKGYAEIDWRLPEESDAQFIRFVGHCKPDEAAEMANVIAAYRRSSDAFVITNAVKVGEDTEGAELELASLEAINKFNVMDALKEYLSVEDVKILESLNA